MGRGRVGAVVLTAALAAPSFALAHVERPAYFPDPAADRTVVSGAGGQVPRIRKLSSSLDANFVGDTRVVCQSNSLSLVKQAIAKARRDGYEIRRTEKRRMTARQGRLLMRDRTS